MAPAKLIFLVALFIGIFDNVGFFKAVIEVYPPAEELLALLSLFLALTASIHLILRFLSFHTFVKPVLILALLTSSAISYFTNTYGVVMDQTMLLNMVNTDPREVRDLLNGKLFLYILLLGILPSLFVWKIRLQPRTLKQELASYSLGFTLSLLVMAAVIAPFGKFYASFLREHKNLRSYVNPTYLLYSASKSVGSFVVGASQNLTILGSDSQIPASDKDRELIIFVLGETARSDHFSLNGYGKKTNPLLEKEDLVSFSAMTSCGTSTATSVPCMFSAFGREGYSDRKAKSTENLVDVLGHTNRINILWRDNNSDSKGVALRIPYQDFRNPKVNKICDEECRDLGMLNGLQEYIDSHPKGDFFIVLHQMGNHGPAYYKRYPKEFEVFKPACHNNQLEKCSREEISNAYDNALLYTDFFLSKTIAFLKHNSSRFESALLYVSDHGESLGEHGVYLHGLPYMLAPDEQKKVGAILWLSDHLKKELGHETLKARSHLPHSHDNIFHSVLGLMEVESSVYRKELDIFNLR